MPQASPRPSDHSAAEDKRGSSPLDHFDDWCRNELFTPDLREATRLVDRYCDLQLAGIYRDIGLEQYLATPKRADDLAPELGYVDTASITLRDMLRRLAERTGTVRIEGPRADETFVHVESPPDPADELKRIQDRLLALGQDYIAATEFIDFGRKHFVHALANEPDFMDKLLSGRMKDFAELWHRATNTNPLQDLHGEMGARVIDGLLERGKILEIGGGTGNGARHLFDHLEREGRLDKIEQYIFTDISTRFVLSSKHELGKKYPSVDWGWKFFDLNKPFGEQKIEPGSMDLIYAVNAAHVAKDIVKFLRGAREALRPGGHVVFAERVRVRQYEMAPRELTLNLSIYHRTAAEKADYRPMHCYLSPENWREVLELAGFSRCQILPDLDGMAKDFPEQYAVVVVGHA